MNPKLVILATTLVLGLLVTSQPARSQGLEDFAGSWSGTTIGKVAEGDSERLRCETLNSIKNEVLSIVLRCAGTSVSLHIRAKLTRKGNAVSGTWEERAYGADGTLSGTLEGNELRGRVTSTKFTGTMTVIRVPDGLNVTVVATEGIGRFSVWLR